MIEYEYAVAHHAYPDETWRGPWPLEKCLAWIQDAVEDGCRLDIFHIIRRPVHKWERFNQES